MRRAALRCALIALIAAAAPLAAAPLKPVADTCPTAAPVAEAAAHIPALLAWIEAHSPYRASVAPPPTVSFCNPGEIIHYEGHDVLIDPHLRAAYDLPARRIYLVRPWSAGNPRDLSALLHELVHHLQFLSRSWPCPQAAEWEAYHLQADWLAERGIEAGFNWPQIGMMSRCPRDPHP